MSKKVVIQQDPDDQIPLAVLALAIKNIAAAMVQVEKSGLNRDALVTLLIRNCRTSVSRCQVNDVLNNLAALERNCLK